LEAAYFAALKTQLARLTEGLGLAGKRLRGLDLGGGTPSLVEPARLGEIVAWVLARLRPAPGFGMSIETTPKIAALAPARLAAYRAFGIERISLGLQTVSAGLLHAYGREVQQVDHNRRAVENIRAAGFRTLNVDLMYGFARQGLDDWAESLRAAVALGPEVITLYRMRYKGTRVEGEAAEAALSQAVAMAELAGRTLAEAGYHAPPGKNAYVRSARDPGTSAYLTSRVVESVPYLGLGLGAQTFTNHLLAYNHGAATKQLEPYLRALDAGELGIQDLYHLPPSEGMAKMISVSFYFGAVRLDTFQRRFGVALEERFPAEVEFVLGRGLMERAGSALRLTAAGAQSFPGVIALFYSAAVQRHLLGLEGG
ncbi:MAG TPA: coproporphyrinogen III oxidase, partial [Myxococcota bacterium]|nr:coproporphyrinogen III oxidase [Myxococcota bacterium]